MKSIKRIKLYGAYKEAFEGKISSKKAKEKTLRLLDLIDWQEIKRINY